MQIYSGISPHLRNYLSPWGIKGDQIRPCEARFKVRSVRISADRVVELGQPYE